MVKERGPRFLRGDLYPLPRKFFTPIESPFSDKKEGLKIFSKEGGTRDPLLKPPKNPGLLSTIDTYLYLSPP